jgi:hypothetical protein
MRCLWLVVLYFGILQSGCTKDDTIENRRALLIEKKWQAVSMISKSDTSDQEIDMFINLPEYRKDDFFIFNPDSTYELNDNLILRSDTTEIIIDAGKWELSDGNNYLQMHSYIFTTTYYPALIKELTENSLMLETYYATDSSTVTTRYRAVE